MWVECTCPEPSHALLYAVFALSSLLTCVSSKVDCWGLRKVKVMEEDWVPELVDARGGQWTCETGFARALEKVDATALTLCQILCFVVYTWNMWYVTESGALNESSSL